MSYQLTFVRPRGQAALQAEAVQAYFDAHPRYQVGQREAIYTHDSTGAVFTFRWGEPAAEEAEPAASDEAAPATSEETAANEVPEAARVETARDAAARDEKPAEAEPEVRVRFELPYFRPRTLALEAADELEAFVAHFQLVVEAPESGRGATRYRRGDSLRAYDAGNRATYQLMLQHNEGAARATLPLAEQERCWRWNFGHAALQTALGDSVFVPMVVFVLWNGAVRPAVLWTDCIPFVLPPVELVVLHRNELAKKRFFLFKKQSLAIVPYEAVVGAMDDPEAHTEPLPHHVVRGPTRRLVELFRSAPAYEAQLELIPAPRVHDRETVERIRAELAKDANKK